MKKCMIVLFCLVSILAYSADSAKKVKLIFDTQDFAPFSYLEKGKVAGSGADIVDLVCKEMDVDYEIRLLPWTRAQAEVKSGEANALFFIGKNKEREEWLEFGPSIIKTEYGFFVGKNDPVVLTDLKNLANYTVGVYGPSNTSTSLMEAIVRIENIKVEMTVDDIAGFKKLDAKRLEAVYSNSDVGKAIIKDLKLTNIRYGGTHKKLQYYIGFSKKSDKTIVDKFYKVLEEHQKNGNIKKILDKYGME